MKRMFVFALAVVGLLGTATALKAQERLPEYLQAEKFTQDKLSTMLFSTQ